MMIQIFSNALEGRCYLEQLKQRSRETGKEVEAAVSQIIEKVRVKGDEAVREYSLRFDGGVPEQLEIGREEM